MRHLPTLIGTLMAMIPYDAPQRPRMVAELTTIQESARCAPPESMLCWQRVGELLEEEFPTISDVPNGWPKSLLCVWMDDPNLFS